MTDDEYVMHYENSKSEWEEELRNNTYCNIGDHKHWCAENNFGVNNFGLNLKHLPLSKVTCDFLLHMSYATMRKMTHWFRSHADRHENNENVYTCFETLKGNTCY